MLNSLSSSQSPYFDGFGAQTMQLQQYLSVLHGPLLPSGNLKNQSLFIFCYCFPFCISLLFLSWIPSDCFAIREDIEMRPYHQSFHFFTRVRRSSCTPIASWMSLQISSFMIFIRKVQDQVSLRYSSYRGLDSDFNSAVRIQFSVRNQLSWVYRKVSAYSGKHTRVLCLSVWSWTQINMLFEQCW